MLRLFRATRSPSHKIRSLSPLGQLGWTLVEMILVVSILGTLLAIIRPSVHQYVERARVAKAIADVQAIQSDLAGPALLDAARAEPLVSRSVPIPQDGELSPPDQPPRLSRIT